MRVLRHSNLRPPSANVSLLHASATAENDAVALWVDESRRDQWVITRQSRSSLDSMVVEAPVEWEDPLVQAIPDGGVLIATPSCEWADGRPQRNARHLSADGELLRESTIGAGIEHLLTDSVGNVWVGFADEGIFSGAGWEGDEDAFPPIGGPGLLRYDSNLELSWTYQGQGNNYGIADCYALNVNDTEVFTCFYTEFVIAKVGSEPTEHWTNNRTGPTAILVAGNNVALVGGYGGKQRRLAIGHLDAGEFVIEAEQVMDRRARRSSDEKAWAVGRGPELHLFHNLEWSRFTLGD